MLRGLKRLVMQVDDLAAARKWYGEFLDSQPIYDTPLAAIFQIGDCSLSLVRPEPVAPAGASASDTASASAGTSAGTHIDAYWDTEDVAAAIDRLTAMGAQVVTPMREFMQMRTALLCDPFGNRIGLTGAAPVTRTETVAERPSQSAITVAFSRALAAREPRPTLRGPDSLAHLFLPEEARPILDSPDKMRWAIDHQLTAPLYAYFLARTAYIDRLFADACRSSLPQIVFLGAGYDTRPYRFRDSLGSTRIFEVDSAPTQQRKRGILGQAGITAPDSLTFVTIDFEHESLAQCLLPAGFDPKKETLFIWEGVTYYLSETAVAETLGFVSSHAPAGSRLCLDYLQQKLESVHAAEPFRFCIPRVQFPELLARHGFELIEDLDASDLERRFLTLPDGTSGDRVMTRFGLALARIR